MPTYEYQCKNCNYRFEAWQKMTDEPLKVCPNCQGEIRRVLFPAGIVFKGSGFYKTDHSSPANGNGHNGHGDASKKEEAGTSGETAKAGETKTESKTESKASGESGGGEKSSEKTSTAAK